MGEDGYYRLYRNYHYDDGRAERRLVGRFEVKDSVITVLEDHDGVLEKIFPSGPMSDKELNAMFTMESSPYWSLVQESPVVAG